MFDLSAGYPHDKIDFYADIMQIKCNNGRFFQRKYPDGGQFCLFS